MWSLLTTIVTMLALGVPFLIPFMEENAGHHFVGVQSVRRQFYS